MNDQAVLFQPWNLLVQVFGGRYILSSEYIHRLICRRLHSRAENVRVPRYIFWFCPGIPATMYLMDLFRIYPNLLCSRHPSRILSEFHFQQDASVQVRSVYPYHYGLIPQTRLLLSTCIIPLVRSFTSETYHIY